MEKMCYYKKTIKNVPLALQGNNEIMCSYNEKMKKCAVTRIYLKNELQQGNI